jgi:carbamoyl-phosphate synthase large subunit
MGKRLLITGAGSGPTNSLIRSLRAGDPSLVVLGCHHDRFLLKKSAADANFVVPAADAPTFVEAIGRLVQRERVDLVVPNSDLDVRAVSDARAHLGCRTFLPRKAVVDLCQDKYELAVFLRDRGLPAPETYPVTDIASIAGIFDRLRHPPLAWCRIRTGTGSRGAIPVKRAEQAASWIRYWQEMRGVAVTDFIISEYLPGRDLTCESLWDDGTLILIKTVERLTYFGGAERPSGVSSNAALAKTIAEPALAATCAAVVRAVDPAASGLFSVDLKEDPRGVARVTEINIGRVLSTTNLFDLAGKHNMALAYIRTALGEPPLFRNEYDAPEDYYFVRDLDTLPDIVHADDLFEGIDEAG